MLLLSIVYDDHQEDIIDQVTEMRNYFAARNVVVGIAESLVENTHFVKIFCDDNCTMRFINNFNLYTSNIIYNIVIEEFYKKEMQNFLVETFFFLKYDEIKEVKEQCLKAMKCEGQILDDSMIYCLNKKNSITDKIMQCILENKEINIGGFITFRMKELRLELEDIIEKVVEKYMVEKEYNEFIKLLKYFVEIQDSKIEEVHIIIEEDGSYLIRNKDGDDIMEQLMSELSDTRFSGAVSMEDMLISGLITNSPERIIIHCKENCLNKEVIDTISNVFTDRLDYCNDCVYCEMIRQPIKT